MRNISYRQLLKADRQIVKADQLPEWIGQDVDLTGLNLHESLDYLMGNEDYWITHGVEAGLDKLRFELSSKSRR